MALKDILAISGKPGLYRYVAKARNGIVVESLQTHRRMPVPVSANVSALSDVAMYTDGDDVPLADVFTAMLPHQEAIKALDVKRDEEGVKSLFATVLPSYARERVRVVDMQKAFRWFRELVENGVTEFKDGEEPEPAEE